MTIRIILTLLVALGLIGPVHGEPVGWVECNETQHRSTSKLGFALLYPAYSTTALIAAKLLFI